MQQDREHSNFDILQRFFKFLPLPKTELTSTFYNSKIINSSFHLAKICTKICSASFRVKFSFQHFFYTSQNVFLAATLFCFCLQNMKLKSIIFLIYMVENNFLSSLINMTNQEYNQSFGFNLRVHCYYCKGYTCPCASLPCFTHQAEGAIARDQLRNSQLV